MEGKTKKDYRLTQVFIVEGKLVVADNSVEAIEIYCDYYSISKDKVHNVEAIHNNQLIKDYSAIMEVKK